MYAQSTASTRNPATGCSTSIRTSVSTVPLANLYVPENAIFPEDQVPEDEQEYIALNYDYDYDSSEPGKSTPSSPDVVLNSSVRSN